MCIKRVCFNKSVKFIYIALGGKSPLLSISDDLFCEELINLNLFPLGKV